MTKEGFVVDVEDVYNAVKELDSKFDAQQLSQVAIQTNHEGRIAVVEKKLDDKDGKRWQTNLALIGAAVAMAGTFAPLFIK